jgi:hypothetical protein
VLVIGHCPDCKRGVSGLLAGDTTAAAAVNRSELAPFMAGVALAVILIAYSAGK